MQNAGSRLKLVDRRAREKTLPLLKKRLEVRCQRCLRERWSSAIYRVFTEAMDMKVCAARAGEARKLGIYVEPLDSGEGIRFQSSGFSR